MTPSKQDTNVNTDYIVSMKDIVKKYRMGEGEELTILKGINLNIREGEFVSILGPSGSGKSTCLNLLGCLDTPTSGEYILANQNVAGLDEEELSRIRAKEIGFVFQSFYLLPRLSIIENVELAMLYAGFPLKERKEIAAKMLEKVGLKGKENHRPNQLSGGQQQRVAIARALATNPSILLCDEPTGALDSQTGKQVFSLFKQLHAEGRTIIIITHDESIAKETERIVRICDGNISEDGEVNV